MKAVLYEENLGKALRKWIHRELRARIAAGELAMSESDLNNFLSEFRRREGSAEVGSKRRRFYYRGLRLRQEHNENVSAP